MSVANKGVIFSDFYLKNSIAHKTFIMLRVEFDTD